MQVGSPEHRTDMAVFHVQISAGLGGSPPRLAEVHLAHASVLVRKHFCGIGGCFLVVEWWFGGDFDVLAVGEGWEGRRWVLGEEERRG